MCLLTQMQVWYWTGMLSFDWQFKVLLRQRRFWIYCTEQPVSMVRVDFELNRGNEQSRFQFPNSFPGQRERGTIDEY